MWGDNLTAAIGLVFQFDVLLAIVLAAVYGLFVGAIPGLSATMAVALLVPVTFFMDPVPAIAMMVTSTGMAIFSGDIPGCLLRIPGTPSSAAYTEEAYAMTKKGQSDLALGVGLVCSAIGGMMGTFALILVAPLLAEFALNFSSYEYFWLVLLGLTCAIFIGGSRPLKGFISLLVGLAITTVGIENPGGYPRFTFGQQDLISGYSLIPLMVGMFAVSEVLRFAIKNLNQAVEIKAQVGNIFHGTLRTVFKYPKSVMRGSLVGTLVGALPGAGADIGAYIAYGLSKKFSKTPEKFGTGHPEGIVEASSANNAGLSGAWIPALVFGIPGDSITAIVIGVLYMKGLNPGPTIFTNNAASMYAIFLVFILANILLIPLGFGAIKLAKQVLRIPQKVLMPIILLFCAVGSYSISNNIFDVWAMLLFGVIAYLMEENDYPLAPAILGVILGSMLEVNFVNSVIKAEGQWIDFVNRPVAGSLAAITMVIWFAPAIIKRVRKKSAFVRN